VKIYQKLLKLLVIALFSALLLTIVFVPTGSSDLEPASGPTLGIKDTTRVQPPAFASPGEAKALNPNPPSEGVKLVFIHHSCGNNWLDAGHGDLGDTLGDNHYYVSDTYYDWGPDSIGSYTDIGNWWRWFRGENSSIYLSALYTTTNQNADYTRPMADPGGENEIIMFKSCYPNSNIWGNPDDPPNDDPNPPRDFAPNSADHNVANIKRIYNDILEYFETRQDKLFVVITAPPRVATSTDAARAANARAVNNWLVYEWLADYAYHNVAVFDFYNVLTTNGGDADTNDYGWSTGNHHRVVTTTVPITIEHITDGDDDDSPDILEYPTGDGTNNHPSAAGNQKATGEFVPLLNAYYNCWKHGDCWDEVTDWISVTAVTDVSSVYPGETATFTLSVSASEGFSQPVTLALQGAPPGVTVSFDPNPVTPPGTSQLDVATTASTVAGTIPMTVTGSSGLLADTATLTLIVTSAAPSFTLSISPTVRLAEPNQVVSCTVTVRGIHGFDQPVTLEVVGLPTGVGAAWSTNPVTPDGFATLTLYIPSDPPWGDHPFHVVGTSGTHVVTEQGRLIVNYPYKSYLPIVSKQGWYHLSVSGRKTPPRRGLEHVSRRTCSQLLRRYQG
jgi:hypothetical protein